MKEGKVTLRPAGERPFRVRVEDAEDLGIASSYLQDAILPAPEMKYEPAERRFVLLVQRFKWENAPAPIEEPEEDAVYYERVHCVVRFEYVAGVKSIGIDRLSREAMLNLLAIRAGEGHIDLAFAGGKTIRLAVDRILCHIEDLGEPWPTVFRPGHGEALAEDGNEAGGGTAT